jgi:hypothetical protein
VGRREDLAAEAERLLARGRSGLEGVRDLVHEMAADFDLVIGDAPALAIPVAANRKLAPVEMQVAFRADGRQFERKRPVPQRPHCSSTYLPVKQTCPETCPFQGNGCMAEAGYTGRAVKRLEELATTAVRGLSRLDAATRLVKAEARAIDSMFARGVPKHGGRDGNGPVDMRLHVSGDVTTAAGLRYLRSAVERWQRRGGGTPWTFTHAWRRLHRALWGPISVLASVETPEEAEEAWRRGYTPAMTVREFPAPRAFHVEGSGITWIPCPAELRKATCVQCRLCLDRADWLHAQRKGIAFQLHGPERKKAARRLPVLR